MIEYNSRSTRAELISHMVSATLRGWPHTLKINGIKILAKLDAYKASDHS